MFVFLLYHLCVSQISAQFLNPYIIHCISSIPPRHVYIFNFKLAQILLYYPKSRSSNKANPIVNGLNVTYIRRTPLSIRTPFSHTRGMFLRNWKTVWLPYLVSSVLIPMWSILAILPPFPPLFHCPFCRRERLPWLRSSHVLLISVTQKKNKTLLAIHCKRSVIHIGNWKNVFFLLRKGISTSLRVLTFFDHHEWTE